LGRLTSTPYLVLFILLGAVGVGAVSAMGVITFSSPLNMSDNPINNLAEPIEDSDAATKGYVDSLFSCEGGTAMCSVGVGECQRDGINICVSGNSQCGVVPGTPETEICDGLDNDCDGSSDEDFDLQNNPNNCGSCGAVCDSTNVDTLSCTSSVCTPICDPGFGNCNDEQIFNDGCEELLDSNPVCNEATALFIGSIRGDTGADTIFRSGHGEQWFRVTVTEGDTSSIVCENFRFRVYFSSNPGSTYSIEAFCDDCGGTLGDGNPDERRIRWDEECPGGLFPSTSDSGRDILVHVFYSGSITPTCDQWGIQFEGNQGINAPGTCPPK